MLGVPMQALAKVIAPESAAQSIRRAPRAFASRETHSIVSGVVADQESRIDQLEKMLATTRREREEFLVRMERAEAVLAGERESNRTRAALIGVGGLVAGFSPQVWQFGHAIGIGTAIVGVGMILFGSFTYRRPKK